MRAEATKEWLTYRLTAHVLTVIVPVIVIGLMISAMTGGQALRQFATALCGN